MNGCQRTVLIDTGCSRSIVHVSACADWRQQRESVYTVSGERSECAGVGRITIQLDNGATAVIDSLVVQDKPLGLDMILGMDGIKSLGA